MISKQLIFFVRQRLSRCYRDAIPRVHAHRVDVLDRADDDAVVGVGDRVLGHARLAEEGAVDGRAVALVRGGAVHPETHVVVHQRVVAVAHETVAAHLALAARAEAEQHVVADGDVDVIMSNCVINLSPNKQAVFEEAFRVLAPGGELRAVHAVQPFDPGLRDDAPRVRPRRRVHRRRRTRTNSHEKTGPHVMGRSDSAAPNFSRILRFVDNVTPQLLPKSEKRQLPKSFTHHSRSNFDVSFQVGLWQNSTCGPYQFEGHLQSLSHWQKQGLSKNPHFPDCLIDSPQGFISSNM